MPKTPDDTKKWLNDPIHVHFHIGDPEPRLTPLALRDLEVLHTNALAYIQQLEAQVPRWISVEERLPEELKDVLVYRDGCFAIARIITGDDWTYCGMGGDPTHWMPLPQSPKEESNNV